MITKFQKNIWDFYRQHGRDLPWRQTRDPYKILVSEVMLQQTQVDRLIPKYEMFIQKFPNFETLSNAPFRKVLLAWSGLGYNRRARYLHQTSKIVRSEFKGVLPGTIEDLVKLPGIGHATASAILAFAFNRSVVFIETNIRSVFLHFFFPSERNVRDSQLLPYIEESLDRKNPREWYFALMDYGAHLKKKYPNPARRSAHHTRQSKFEGSDRQLRGLMLRYMLQQARCREEDLLDSFEVERLRSRAILKDLIKEGFITRKGSTLSLID